MFDHILVPLDGSALAECVLPHVVSIAQTSEAQITLLHVLDPASGRDTFKIIDPWNWMSRKAEAAAYLRDVCVHLKDANLPFVTVIDEGYAADRIIQYAHDHQISLIAMSSHGQSGLSGWNISSVVQKVLLRAYTSSLIVPAYQTVHPDLTGLQYERILVALDCSQRAEHVLPVAANLAAFHHSSLLIAHIVSKPIMPSQLPLTGVEVELMDQVVKRNQREAEDYLRRIRSRLSSELFDVKTYLVVSDHSVEALHELVERERADLLILSAHGCSGGRRWPYGSVTLSFIAYGAIPLLILQDLSLERITVTRAEIAATERARHPENSSGSRYRFWAGPI